MDVEILRQENCYQGFFRLERYRLRHSLFAGGWSGEVVRECLERGHAAAVLPYDPVLDKVLLVEQFRIGAFTAGRPPWLLEPVAGIVEPGESVEEVARRESVEEAGCELGRLECICDYIMSPGGCSESISLFCGEVDSSQLQSGGIFGLDEEHEDIRLHVLDFAQAMDLLEAGRLGSATPIIALQWLALKRDWLRRRWGIAK